jgi:hypothetical protein
LMSGAVILSMQFPVSGFQLAVVSSSSPELATGNWEL